MSFRRFDPPALYEALNARRAASGMSWAELAEVTGTSRQVFRRLADYRRFTVNEVLPLVQWLNRPLTDFTRLGPPPEQLRGTKALSNL